VTARQVKENTCSKILRLTQGHVRRVIGYAENTRDGWRSTPESRERVGLPDIQGGMKWTVVSFWELLLYCR
jgi:hypothetical protein